MNEPQEIPETREAANEIRQRTGFVLDCDLKEIISTACREYLLEKAEKELAELRSNDVYQLGFRYGKLTNEEELKSRAEKAETRLADLQKEFDDTRHERNVALEKLYLLRNDVKPLLEWIVDDMRKDFLSKHPECKP